MQTTLSGVEASFAVAVKMPFPCYHRPSGEIELPDEVGVEDGLELAQVRGSADDVD